MGLEEEPFEGVVTLTLGESSIEFGGEQPRLLQLLFELADVGSDGLIGREEGRAFLQRSRLDDDILKSIWALASDNGPSLRLEQWFIACKLVAAAQKGLPCTPEAVANAGALPPPDFNLSTTPLPPCSCGSCGEAALLDVDIDAHDTVKSGYSTFTTYRLQTHTTMPRFARRDVVVYRRFRDFEWLHNCFSRIGGILLPPLPPKRLVGTQGAAFIAERQKWLARYIRRLARHPVLRRSYELQVFLEGSPAGLDAAKLILPWTDGQDRSLRSAGGGDAADGGGSEALGSPTSACSQAGSPRRRSGGGGSGGGSFGGSSAAASPASSAGTSPAGSTMVEMVSVPVHTWSSAAKGYAGSLWGGVKTAVGLSKATAPVFVEQDAAYEAAVKRLTDYEPTLAHAAEVAERVVALKRGQAYEMSRLGHYLQEVAKLEGGSGQEVRMLAGVGAKAEGVGMKWLDGIELEVWDFLDVLKEHRGYMAMAHAVVQQRCDAVAELQSANGSLQRNKQRLQAARASGARCKAEEAQGKMTEAELRMDEARARMLAVASNFKGEAVRYEKERLAEMQAALLNFAQQQAKQARENALAWKRALEDVRPTDAEMLASRRRIRAAGGTTAAGAAAAAAAAGSASADAWPEEGRSQDSGAWGSSAGASAEEGAWDGGVAAAAAAGSVTGGVWDVAGLSSALANAFGGTVTGETMDRGAALEGDGSGTGQGQRRVRAYHSDGLRGGSGGGDGGTAGESGGGDGKLLDSVCLVEGMYSNN